MVRALDEPDACYGVLAEGVTISDDRNIFDFAIRPEARFHDGSPLTAEDVAFSFTLFKEKGHPVLLLPLAEMKEATAPDARTARIVFSGKQSAQTILTLVEMPIVSKAYYTANDFEASSMKPPLGSGPYRIGKFQAGLWIEYERVEDYWGRDLAARRGLYNFDRIRIDCYQERQAGFEAFKKGEIHFRQEFTSRVWATGYDFPALRDGKVIKREFPEEKEPSFQAVALNQRRPQFQDARVRRAIALCFDFETTRRTLFFGSYERSQSTFEQSDFKAKGTPSPAELALLEPLRADLPPEVFGEAVTLPASDGSGRDRKLLGQASKLLAEAGWTRKGNVVVNDQGERLRCEMLADDEGIVRLFTPWSQNMKQIGIDASVRLVDATQFEARQSAFDFDLNMMALSIGATPTADSLEGVFHSRSADRPGTRNYAGTKSPAIDALICSRRQGAEPRRTRHRVQRAGSGLARTARLDSNILSAESPRSLLGHVRLQGAEARLRLPGRGDVVVRRSEGKGDWEGLILGVIPDLPPCGRDRWVRLAEQRDHCAWVYRMDRCEGL